MCCINGSDVMGELQMQHQMLRECIEQLKAAELARATLISYLKEALHEQEIKIEQVRHQLQAESRYERATDASAQLTGEQPPAEQRTKESPLAFSETSPDFAPEAAAGSSDEAQITSTRCIQEEPLTENNSSHSESEHRRTAAAEVAAKLTASASSAQMLCHVLSSLASEGVIGQANKEDFSSDNKRLKTENSVPSHVLLLQPPLQPPLPSLPRPQLQHQLPLLPPATHPSPIVEPLPPPTSTSLPSAQPPPPPLITTQFMPSAAGPMTGIPYGYGSALPPLPNYPPIFGIHLGPSAPNPFHSVQASEGANPFAQPPLPAAPPPPLTRQ
ncbi:hypothetical protein GW17_00031950 [Ensete ventricosum]|nr:hypothetical protein GW17_00031950 [Ensete ventricosum]